MSVEVERQEKEMPSEVKSISGESWTPRPGVSCI